MRGKVLWSWNKYPDAFVPDLETFFPAFLSPLSFAWFSLFIIFADVLSLFFFFMKVELFDMP